MRKPCSLLQDLFTLISEAAFEPQRNLHFPLFRHAGTRVVKPRERRGRRLNEGESENIVGAPHEKIGRVSLAVEVATGARPRISDQQSVNRMSPQMELFAAAA